MINIEELIEVETVAYEEGSEGLLSTVQGVTKGWLDPTRITGIVSGAIAISRGHKGLIRTLDYQISRGKEFTLLNSKEGNMLVVGTPDELYKKVADKLAEITAE